jgi:hypothetical protein
VQSDHTSKVFKAWVSRAAQARWLQAGYAAASQVDQVEGLGWFTLLDQAGGALSAHWGLLTSDGRTKKPAFRAYAEGAADGPPGVGRGVDPVAGRRLA